MTKKPNLTEWWHSSGGQQITSTEAIATLQKWWNGSLEFQKSEEGHETLFHAAAMSLLLSKGDQGFTTDDVILLVQRINEMRAACVVGELISMGKAYAVLTQEPKIVLCDLAFRPA